MPHVFISYSASDNAMARELHSMLSLAGAEPFLAELDIAPGAEWKKDILAKLRESDWVFFLATPNSCKSQAVAHEIGASLALEKKFIPIMWKVSAKDLPHWVDDKQAIDLADSSRIASLVKSVGETIKSDKFWTGVIVAALVGFVLWALTRKQ